MKFQLPDKIEVFMVDDYEFNKFINETFPQLQNKYEIIASEELHNGSNYLIKNVGTFNSTFLETQQAFMDRGSSLHTHPKFLLDMAFDKGLIPAGNYLIQVRW